MTEEFNLVGGMSGEDYRNALIGLKDQIPPKQNLNWGHGLAVFALLRSAIVHNDQNKIQQSVNRIVEKTYSAKLPPSSISLMNILAGTNIASPDQLGDEWFYDPDQQFGGWRE